MFSLFKFLLGLPKKYLLWLGTPMVFKVESTLRNMPEHRIKAEYNGKKFEHYGERIATIGGILVLSFLFLILSYLSGGVVLWLIPLIFVITFLIDVLLGYSRSVHTKNEEVKAKKKNELVPLNSWKDTSLSAILKQREEEVKKWNDDFREKNGREPRSYEKD